MYVEGFWEHASRTPVLAACAGPLPWVLARRAVSTSADGDGGLAPNIGSFSPERGTGSRGTAVGMSLHGNVSTAAAVSSSSPSSSSSLAPLCRPRGGVGRSPLPRIARPMWMPPGDVYFLLRVDASSDTLATCLGRLGMPVVVFNPSPTAPLELRTVARGVDVLGMLYPPVVLFSSHCRCSGSGAIEVIEA